MASAPCVTVSTWRAGRGVPIWCVLESDMDSPRCTNVSVIYEHKNHEGATWSEVQSHAIIVRNDAADSLHRLNRHCRSSGRDARFRNLSGASCLMELAAMEPGTIVDERYRVERLMHTGLARHVYRASRASDGAPVAIKV